MKIEPIQIKNIRVQRVDTSRNLPPPIVSSLSPPVTVDVGLPIVDIPGCVEARTENNGSETIFGDDPNGVVTLCGPGVPSYNPINFEPEQIILTGPAEPPPIQPPQETPEVKAPTVPPPPPPPPIPNCPTASQNAKEPVGSYVQGFRKIVTEYKLIGNECVQFTEDVGLPQQIIAGVPSGGTVMQTGGIAVVATTSALLAKPLADLLLKVIKPTVKKVIKKISTLRGKKTPIESVRDRRGQQRIRSHAIRKLKGKE